jgi:hypothetical protein
MNTEEQAFWRSVCAAEYARVRGGEHGEHPHDELDDDIMLGAVSRADAAVRALRSVRETDSTIGFVVKD